MARVAIVTGGSRGIGAAISMALDKAGYKVAANYAGNDEAAAKFKAETGIAVYKWSVADYDACAAGIKQVEADLGPVDVLVNNAGITRDAMFHKMTPQQWKEVIDTNLSGVFNMTHPLWNGMRERKFGRVITISSINGQKGQAGQVNYSASKAGDIGFTKALAQEGARAGITVNVICPGYIATEMVKAIDEKVLNERIIAADPDRPARRAGGNRALRGVPGLRRGRLDHRLDDHRQWRPVFRLRLVRLVRQPCQGGAAEARQCHGNAALCQRVEVDQGHDRVSHKALQRAAHGRHARHTPCQFQHLQRSRTAQGLVEVQRVLGALAFHDIGQDLPQNHGIHKSGVHALATSRAVHVCRVAHEHQASGPCGMNGDAMVQPKARAPDNSCTLAPLSVGPRPSIHA